MIGQRACPATIDAIISMNSGWSPTVGARSILIPALARDFRRLDIEIVQHLDVVAQKTNRHDDRRLRVAGCGWFP